MSKTTEVAEVKQTGGAVAIPSYLQGGKKATLGNTDRSDIIIPRVKLLQAISPEVEAFDAAKSGEFWHTIAGESLGPVIKGIPILIKKSYALWAPRGDERGILARASDGVRWDDPIDPDTGEFREFTCKPKGSPRPVTYTLGDTVASSGLDKFGSSIKEDANSQPAAALTYNMLWFFPELQEFSPAMIINTRSSVKKAKLLISKINMRPVDQYGQVYDIKVVKEAGAEGPYNNYEYVSAGYASEEHYMLGKEMYDAFKDQDFRASDEEEEEAPRSGGTPAGIDAEVPF